MITLQSDHMTVRVDESRGGTIRQVGSRADHNVLADYGWSAPLPAEASMTYGSSQLDWLSGYRGGWQELFPNAGASCDVDGVPLPFHGEVSSAEWRVEAHDETSLTIRSPARLPLVLERRMFLESARSTLHLEERVLNESQQDVSFVWAHHPAFDVSPGACIDLPPDLTFEVAEGIPSATQGVAEASGGEWPAATTPKGVVVDLSVVPEGPTSRLVYVRGGADWAAIRPTSGSGVAMAWDVETFPVLWIWNEIGTPGFPWYGRSRITAVEPATSAPADGLGGARGRDEAHVVSENGRWSTWLTMSLFETGEQPISRVHRDGSIDFVKNSNSEEGS